MRLRLLLVLSIASGCAGPRIRMPEQCSPYEPPAVSLEADRRARVSCSRRDDVFFPQAGEFLCYRPEEIMPFLERCGER
jgi:hypothetical protein